LIDAFAIPDELLAAPIATCPTDQIDQTKPLRWA
jgi:hypothetical protein